MTEDQFSEWRRALEGKILDCGPKGEPTSGFFMRATRKGREAIAIWRDKTNKLRCFRSIYGQHDASLTADEIDEILSSCSRYPIPRQVFDTVVYEGGKWPVWCETVLTLQEIREGIAWTPKLGQQKIETEWVQTFQRRPKWKTEEDITMRISAAFPSEYLRAADLDGRPVTVIISHVDMQDIGGEMKPILHFQGKDKGMVLNKTNSAKISDLYGDETEQWTGQKITLYEAMVDFQGRTVPAIRVRAASTKPMPPKPTSSDEFPDEPIPF